MIIPDVNVLVYAFKRESPNQDAYAQWLQDVVDGEEDLGLLDLVQATDASWSRLTALAAGDRAVRRNLVPDSHLAAVALTHGGRIATADRGFARFSGLRFFNPLDELD